MSNHKSSRFIPIIMATSIVVGIFIGHFYTDNREDNKLGIINTPSNKLNTLLRIIDDQYVDTVNMSELIEEAMPQILNELDPHSAYIPAKDLQAVNDDLRGSFSGIGVQFTIQQDIVHGLEVLGWDVRRVRVKLTQDLRHGLFNQVAHADGVHIPVIDDAQQAVQLVGGRSCETYARTFLVAETLGIESTDKDTCHDAHRHDEGDIA